MRSNREKSNNAIAVWKHVQFHSSSKNYFAFLVNQYYNKYIILTTNSIYYDVNLFKQIVHYILD